MWDKIKEAFADKIIDLFYVGVVTVLTTIFQLLLKAPWYYIPPLAIGVLLLVISLTLLYKRGKAALSKEVKQIKEANSKVVTQEFDPFRRELRSLVKEAKVVWGMWHTGDKFRNEKLLEYGTLKRILVLDPYDNPALEEAVRKAKEELPDIIAQIKSTTKMAKKNNIAIKWHRQYRDISLVIYDTQPTKADYGELKPSSDKAYITAQLLEPKVPRELRHKYLITNNGDDIMKFDAFIEDYEDIWKSKSREPKPEEYL